MQISAIPFFLLVQASWPPQPPRPRAAEARDPLPDTPWQYYSSVPDPEDTLETYLRETARESAFRVVGCVGGNQPSRSAERTGPSRPTGPSPTIAQKTG